MLFQYKVLVSQEVHITETYFKYFHKYYDKWSKNKI